MKRKVLIIYSLFFAFNLIITACKKTPEFNFTIHGAVFSSDYQ